MVSSAALLFAICSCLLMSQASGELGIHKYCSQPAKKYMSQLAAKMSSQITTSFFKSSNFEPSDPRHPNEISPLHHIGRIRILQLCSSHKCYNSPQLNSYASSMAASFARSPISKQNPWDCTKWNVIESIRSRRLQMRELKTVALFFFSLFSESWDE